MGRAVERNMGFGGYTSGLERLGSVPNSVGDWSDQFAVDGLEFAIQPAMLGTAGTEQDPRMA